MRSLKVVIAALLLMLTVRVAAQSDWNVETDAVLTKNIEGSWELDVRSDPGPGAPPPLKALVTFDAGGGVVETILLPPIVPAHGQWIRTGRSTFEFVVVHPILDANGHHALTIRVTSKIRLLNADELIGTFEGHVLDPDGNVLGPLSGSETGKRIKVN